MHAFLIYKVRFFFLNQVLSEPRWRGIVSLRQGCLKQFRIRRKLTAKYGFDEQKSDTRPKVWGNPALEGDAQNPFVKIKVNLASPYERRKAYHGRS
jgi:hypothetical protein